MSKDFFPQKKPCLSPSLVIQYPQKTRREGIKVKLQRRDINLTEGPLLKNVLLFAIPIILSSILQLLFNAADVIVVGRFAGETELAAVGSTGTTVNLIVNVFIGLSISANIIVARQIGARDYAAIGKTVHTSILLAMIMGVFSAIVLFFFAPYFLRLLDTPSDILASASKYLKAYAVGVPANIIYNFGAGILRAKGDTTRPLYFLVIAGVVNVILNLISVLGFHLGAVGVGIATAASQIVACVLILLCLAHEDGPCKLYFSKLRLRKAETAEILRLGLPAGIQSSLFSISNMLITASINSFGSTAFIAGNAACSNIEGFIYAGMHAIYQTNLTLAGQNLGAKKFDRIDKGLGVCCGCAAVIGLVLGVLATIFRSSLISIYSSDPAVISSVTERFYLLVLPYALCGLMETVMGSVRGVGYSLLPMFTSLMGACVFRVVWISTIFAHYHTEASLFVSYPISWILTTAAHFICFLIVRKKIRKNLAL
ncbi:MAG: MATE family efflux transporter [Clostridia bacterium]|nr:MATE family efflux transporter [Clostridia bacterium]